MVEHIIIHKRVRNVLTTSDGVLNQPRKWMEQKNPSKLFTILVFRERAPNTSDEFLISDMVHCYSGQFPENCIIINTNNKKGLPSHSNCFPCFTLKRFICPLFLFTHLIILFFYPVFLPLSFPITPPPPPPPHGPVETKKIGSQQREAGCWLDRVSVGSSGPLFFFSCVVVVLWCVHVGGCLAEWSFLCQPGLARALSS